MRRRNELIFDDMTSATSTQPAYTSDRYDSMLAEFDQMAIHVLVDEVSAAGANFELFIEHSADGRFWLPKNSITTSGDIEIVGLSTTVTNSVWGSDPGKLVSPPTPFLGHARLRIYFTTVAISAHVKVYVTQRDQGT